MDKKLRVSSNPHIRSKVTTNGIMMAVALALLPAAGFGIYNFGIRALLHILITVASTVLTEFLFGLYKKKLTITDLSAVVTGLLLALNLPAGAPLWIGALGGVFAILVVKMLFGGLGQNFMNPALAARCFLLISFPALMTNFTCDAYTGATPLAALKAGETVNVTNMIIGRTAGTIGETSMIALVAGLSSDSAGCDRPADSRQLYSEFCPVCAALWRQRDGLSVPVRPFGRRRSDAGSLLHGHGLCDQAHYSQRTICIRCISGDYDGDIPHIRSRRGGRVLRDHPGQSAGTPDREGHHAQGIWQRRCGTWQEIKWITR